MAKSITELFSRNSNLVPLPKNDGQPRDIKDGTGSWVTTSHDEGNTDSYKNYLAEAVEVIPTNDPDNEGVYTSTEEYRKHAEEAVLNAMKRIENTLEKYDQFKKDPAAYMALFGGLLPVNINIKDKGASTYNKLNELADKVGLGLPGIVPNGVIPIPAYMSYEDGRIINAAMNTIQSTLKSAIGGRMRPNYDMLFLTQTGGDLMNAVLNTLTDDFFKKEFEKGRLPWQMPGTDLTAHTWSIYKSQDDCSWADSKNELWSAVKGVIKNAVDDFMEKQDSNAANILYGKSKLKGEVFKEYSDFRDPYDGESNLGESGNINDIFKELSKKDLLRGYKDYAGFELGSNHNWIIKLRPYLSQGRTTVTPPLPVYALPNLWSSSNSITSTLFDPKTNDKGKNGNWNKLINSWTDRIIENTFDRLTFGDEIDDMPSESTLGGVLIDAAKKAIWGKDEDGKAKNPLFRWFSFSKHTPVISYDLNFGTIRTESQRLFNGSSVEMFSGMQFNSTLNMSILDDAYHSMYKYMIEYTNNIYDITTGAMAPYHSMAFEIELIIMRTGNKINHHYKFIGIPIEFTPRLDGSDQPNECRVDLTFGIIGLIKPDNLKSNVYSKNTLSRGDEFFGKLYDTKAGIGAIHDVKGQLEWGDIMINVGGNLKEIEI